MTRNREILYLANKIINGDEKIDEMSENISQPRTENR